MRIASTTAISAMTRSSPKVMSLSRINKKVSSAVVAATAYNANTGVESCSRAWRISGFESASLRDAVSLSGAANGD
jgi:hypothetical protein